MFLKSSNKEGLKRLFALSFFIAIQISIAAYVNSSFLSVGRGFSESTVGLIYSIASLIVVVELFFSSTLFERLGNKFAIAYTLLLNIVALAGLIFFSQGFLTLLFFIIYFASNGIIWYFININIEHYSTDKETGGIRGVLLTVTNLAWFIAPFLAGKILFNTSSNFMIVYIIAMLASFVALMLTVWFVPHYKVYKHKRIQLFKKAIEFWSNLKLRYIFLLYLLQSFFYATMIIYTPIYLIQHLGLTWADMSMVLPIMLIPFVLLSLPIGRLLDKRKNEKIWLFIGMSIIIFTMLFASLWTSSIWWHWAIILAGTRIGASITGVSMDSFFYKHISDKDEQYISFITNASPLSYIVAPLLMSFVIWLSGEVRFVFIFLGLIMLFGLYLISKLPDERKV